jgi:hypothetical protein
MTSADCLGRPASGRCGRPLTHHSSVRNFAFDEPTALSFQSRRRLFEPESSRSHLIVKGKRGGYGHAGRNLHAATGSDGADEQGIHHPEHVSVRARHLAGDAFDADLRSKYSLGLNRERTGAKKPARLSSRRGRCRLPAPANASTLNLCPSANTSPLRSSLQRNELLADGAAR